MMPILFPPLLFTPRVVDCVKRMDNGHGYTIVWQELTPAEKFCVERVCKKDKVKRMRVAMLRVADGGESKLIEIPHSYDLNKENIEDQ